MKRWWWPALLLEAAAFVGMRLTGDLRVHAAAFLLWFALAFVSFALLVAGVLAPRDETARPAPYAPWLIAVVGLAFRLTLLPLTPTLSDDIYRYLWDGRVQLADINPYAYTPNAPELAPLRTGDFVLLNHKDIVTIYPPLTEGMYRVAATVRPTIAAQKLMFVAWDVLLVLLLLVALPRWGIPRAWALLYAWNPLVIVEIAGSGHNDVLGICWLVLGCWLWQHERPGWRRGAAVAWGLCFLSKFVSVLLVPWLLMRRDCRRYLGWLALTVTLGYLPCVAGATQLFSGLQRVSAQWEFNSFGYALLVHVWPQPAMARALLLGLLAAWVLLMARRHDDLPSYLLATLGATVLLAPVIEPWYIIWLIPFLCIRPRWSWLAFSGLVALSYMVLIGYVRAGIWHVPLWVKVIEYGTLMGLLVWEQTGILLRSRAAARGAGGKQSVSEAERAGCPAPAQWTKKASDAFCTRMRVPQNASDALRWGGTSEAEIQAAAATLGRRTASLRTPSPEMPRHVSVIIPALNEEEGLRATLAEIPRDMVHDIIVVDNGSTDRTVEVARAAGARVVAEPRRGYGQACLTGIAALPSATDIIVFLDADHSDYPQEIAQLLAPIQRDAADLVIGSRVLGGAQRGSLTPQQRIGNWLACRLIAARWETRFTDLGPFRAVRRATLDALEMRDTAFGWTVEMQIKAVQRGARVAEVPVRYRPRIGRSKISGTWQGSVRAGITILRTIARYA